DLVHRDVHVARARQVARGPHECIAVVQVEDAGHRDQDVVLGDLEVVVGVGGTAAPTLGAAIAVAVAAAATPAATLVVVTRVGAVVATGVVPLVATAGLATTGLVALAAAVAAVVVP